MNPARQAPDFSLSTQTGLTESLSNHRGNVVLLTFLYTNCPDICPIVATHLKNAHALLEEDGVDVDVVVVSVDPERDTVEAVTLYLERLNVERWTYFVGTQGELSPVWASYFVAQAPDDVPASTPVGEPSGALDSLARDIAFYTVTHSSPVYVIDKDGTMRSLFTLPM
ncbi:MAG: SCO family protein, partial [Chloroflexi bacterium]|nr:SCO family protein [Chloroflexota bacterium]